VLDYQLRDKVKAGTVDWKIGGIDAFTAGGVRTKTGDELDCDVVIYGKLLISCC